MRLALIAATAIMFAWVTSGANAMPAAPLKGLSNSDQTITQVRGGCGRGWHRGPRGHCRRN